MIRLALFDMDGTIFYSYLRWMEIRKILSIPQGENILTQIFGKTDSENLKRNRILEEFERKNAQRTRPVKGIREFLLFLKNQEIRNALVTNNNSECTQFLLKKFNLEFDFVLTREKGMWKPEAAPLLYVMRKLKVTPEETISIGDGHYDILASQNAHIKTIFIRRLKKNHQENVNGIHYFTSFNMLQKIIAKRINVDMSTL